MAVGEATGGGDIAEGAMKANLTIVVDEGFGDAFGIIQRQRRFWPDGLLLEHAVKAFDLAFALRVVRRGADVGGLEVANEGFQVLGHELGAIVGDDAWQSFCRHRS